MVLRQRIDMQLVSHLETPTVLSHTPLQKTRLKSLPMRMEVSGFSGISDSEKISNQARRSSDSFDSIIC